MKKIYFYLIAFWALQLSAQTKNKEYFGNLILNFGENWTFNKYAESAVDLNYSKRNAKIALYIHGMLEPEVLSRLLTNVLKDNGTTREAFDKAQQKNFILYNENVIRHTFEDELFLESTNTTIVTKFNVYVFTMRKDRYVILTKEIYKKGDISIDYILDNMVRYQFKRNF